MHNPATSASLRNTLTLALALVLPMGAFGAVPVLNISLVVLLLLLMAAAMPACWRLDWRVRPPAEYWWPAVVLIPTIALTLFRGNHDLAGYLLLAGISFLAPLTLAANGTIARLSVTAFGAACAAGVLLQWGANLAWIPPTVVFPPANLLLAGPETVSAGIVLFIAGFLANLVVVVHPAFPRGHRRVGAIAGGLVAVWLSSLLPQLPQFASTWTEPALYRLPPAAMMLTLIALWIVARVAARTLLRALTTSQPRLLVFPVVLLTLALLHLCLGVRPGLSVVYFVGLAASLDAPWTAHTPFRPATSVWAVPIACVLLQLTGIFPLAPTDLRNQAARGETLLEAEQWSELDAMLRCLLTRQPHQPDYTLLHARSCLAQGRNNAAVAYFCAAPRTANPDLPFRVRNQQAFLDDLRDAASTRPRGHAPFTFERALTHLGEFDDVANLLEIRRGQGADTPSPPIPVETLRASLTLLLGDREQQLKLEDWDAQDLATILRNAGVNLQILPITGPFVSGGLVAEACLDSEGLRVTFMDVMERQEYVFRQDPAPRDLSVKPGSTPAVLRWEIKADEKEKLKALELYEDDRLLATVYPGTTPTAVFHVKGITCPEESTAVALFVP